MNYFTYKKNALFAEEVPVSTLVEEYGTPLFVYSANTIIRHLNAYKDAFDGQPNIICYALKANSSLAILKLLADNGSGADIVSGGELFRALKAGVKPSKIVYAGVGKTEEEIRFALSKKILMFNVESGAELKEIDRVAGDMRVKAPIALRVNPDIDAGTHKYISTGLKKNKFGIPIDEALEHYRLADRLPNVNVVGIHKHIGSQITKVAPFRDALMRTLRLVDELEESGIKIKYLDIGGGLGITYESETPPVPAELAGQILPLLKGREHLAVIIEPGRSIVGNAGILVSKVLYNKSGAEKEFLIVDAGMNDLIRPSLYEAYHRIVPVVKRNRKKTVVDVVGPICESGDFLALDRELERILPGECIAVMSAGAYGFSMGSNYNSRRRPAEVMVDMDKHYLIRDRQKYEDLVRGEKVIKK